MLSFILVDIVALIDKLAEELFTAAVTDIRVLATGGTYGDVQRTRDAEDAGQTEEHGVLYLLYLHCQTGSFQTAEPTGEGNLYLTGEVLGNEFFLGDLVGPPVTHILRLRALRNASIPLDANMQAGWSLIGFHDVELAHINDRGNAIHSRLLHAFSQLANHDAQGEIIAHLMASHQVAKEYLVEQTAYPRTLVAHHQGFRQSAIPEIFLVTLYDIIPILIDSVLVVQINTLKTKIFLERKRIDFFDEIFLVDKVNAFCPI